MVAGSRRSEADTAAPDLVIAGAARSGTSFLAAQLGAHPRIDPGSIKEPNFFSRHLDRGIDWYDGLFAPRAEGVLRMDASVSYTYPQFPGALQRLATAAPDALVVYVVRDPLPRAVSHYLYYRHYFRREDAPDFGAAIAANELYVGASDYRRWLCELSAHYDRERVLVVPFPAVADGDVTAQICSRLDLAAPSELPAHAAGYRNNVVAFRHEWLRMASRTLRRSRLYPIVRERLGADRLRRVRSVVTRDTVLPSAAQALGSCSPQQVDRLAELDRGSREAVREWLREQDARTGLSWLDHWERLPASLAGQ